MWILLALCLVAAEPRDNGVRLVVGYDQSAASKQMFPILAKLREHGYDIVYANLAEPKNAKYLGAFELTKDKTMPVYLLFVGHEAFEKHNGPMTAKALAEWYNRAAEGKPTPTAVKPTQQRDYLRDAPENKVYLRRRLSEPSCGMLWCMSHRREILEYVDASGNVVGRP